MADIEYTWKINRLGVIDSPDYSDYVVEVAWSLTGLLPGDIGVNPTIMTIGHRTQLDRTPPPEFTAYSDLTESQTLEWLRATLGESGVAEAQADIAARLAQLTAPKTEVIKDSTPPWMPAEILTTSTWLSPRSISTAT